MNGALRHPGMQAVAGVGALLAFTWPLLVFERPLYVLGAFFLIWLGVIGLLGAFAVARERAGDTNESASRREEELDDLGD